MPAAAKAYVGGIVGVGSLVLAAGLWTWDSTGALRFVAFLALGAIASTQKLRLPGIRGTVSPGFVFVLIAIAAFSFGETMVMACATALVQSLWKPGRRNTPFQVLFNQGSLAVSAAAAYWLPRIVLEALQAEQLESLLLLLAATLYYGMNTISMLAVVALAEDKPIASLWRQSSLWSYACFLLYALFAGVISASMHSRGWVVTVSALGLSILAYLAMSRLARGFSRPRSEGRRQKRYGSMNLPVDVIWTDRQDVARTSGGRIVEISASGARMESSTPISASTVRVDAGQHKYSALAEVRYCEFIGGTYVIGLEFHHYLNRDQLLEFLYTRASEPDSACA